MKYVCPGYIDENKWETLSENEKNAIMDECFAYNIVLRENGHFVGAEPLQSSRNAVTLRWENDKLSITEGPLMGTKEQLGGILIIETRDLNHSIQLMSKHLGVKVGPFEIRPTGDLTELTRKSRERRQSKIKKDDW